MRTGYILVFAILYASTLTWAKFAEGSVNLPAFNEDSWKYLSKFGYSYGEGQFYVKMRLINLAADRQHHQQTPQYLGVNFSVYVDDNWQEARETQVCDSRLDGTAINLTLWVPTNGDWSSTYQGSLTQERRPHVWFFAMSDCQRVLPPFTGVNSRIEYEIHMTNSDGSEFSVEDQGFQIPLVILIMFLIVFLGVNCSKLNRFYKNEQEIDYPYLILIVANFFQLLSLIMTSVQINYYSWDGKHRFMLAFLSQATAIISQYLMTCLLVLISWGWTILYSNIPHIDLFLPVAVVLGIVQFAVTCLAHALSYDASSRYHDYDNWGGLVILLIQVAFYGYFMVGLKDTISKARQKIQAFSHIFRLLASVYILAFPFLVIIAKFFAPYAQHKVITVGTIGAQIFGISSMAYLFANKESEYLHVSIRGQALLPTEKKD